ncbi:hypothetical protein DV737_g3323, partial [Chaetothyriales sp. CBS 132003]
MTLLRIVSEGYKPSREYHPGDHISGRVIAIFHKQQRVSIAQICFRGKIQTEHWQTRGAGNTRSREHRKEVIRLFEFNQTLFRGPYDIQPQSLEWPFAFTIPTHVDYRRTGNTGPGFIEDGTSPLPSTFFWDSKSFSRDARAYIKYKLVATIKSGGIFKNHELELPILITRFSQSPPPPPQISTHEYYPSPRWSSRALRAQGHTLKQKFRHITSNDPELQTPCISFKAYVYFPTILSPQQHTSIAFSIKPLRITPNDPEAPKLILDTLSLTLKSHTAMVASGSSRDRFAEDTKYEAGHNVVFNPVILPLDGAEVKLHDHICLARWRPRDRWSGDFSTYTIRRDYQMKADAVVRHIGTGHVFSLSTEIPLCVLDRHPEQRYDRPPPGGNDGVGVVRSGDGWYGDEELDQPPAYNADVRPPNHDEEE